MEQLSAEASKEMMFRNSEWGPEANKEMIDEISSFPIKLGGALGDLIEATDKDRISRVYIEEKIFHTWNYERTALIGDGKYTLLKEKHGAEDTTQLTLFHLLYIPSFLRSLKPSIRYLALWQA